MALLTTTTGRRMMDGTARIFLAETAVPAHGPYYDWLLDETAWSSGLWVAGPDADHDHLDRKCDQLIFYEGDDQVCR